MNDLPVDLYIHSIENAMKESNLAVTDIMAQTSDTLKVTLLLQQLGHAQGTLAFLHTSMVQEKLKSNRKKFYQFWK
jgi:hypothetical protein